MDSLEHTVKGTVVKTFCQNTKISTSTRTYTLPYKVVDMVLMKNTPLELIIGQNQEVLSVRIDMSMVPLDVREGEILGRLERKNFWWVRDLETRIGARLYQEDVKNPEMGLNQGAHVRFKFAEYAKGLRAKEAEILQSIIVTNSKVEIKPKRQLAFVMDIADDNNVTVKYVERDVAETIGCSGKLYRGDLVYIEGPDKQITVRNGTRGFFYQDARGIYRIGTPDGIEYMFHSRNTINRGRVTMSSAVDFEISQSRNDFVKAINLAVLPEELLTRDKIGLIVAYLENHSGGQIFNEAEDLITEFTMNALQFKPDGRKCAVLYDTFPQKGRIYVFNVRLAPDT